MFTDRQQIQEALLRTGRRLALADAGEFALLVCGGSALNLAGIIQRPTRDVDVLGLIKGTEPATVAAAIDRVKGQRHLKDLEAIAPTKMELEFAVHWLLDRETSPQFREAVRSIAEALGFNKLRAFSKKSTAGPSKRPSRR